ncbi:MAG: acyl--CoA ligase [Anaerolineales bacterium]|nr:acyl--CoA ligase [Anaerolineales bacterium]
MILHTRERIETYTENGWWGTETIDDLLHKWVAEKPEALAMVDPLNRADFTDGAPQKYTFAEVETAVQKLAAVLLANGIGQDDIVAIQLPNIAELVLSYLALSRIGAIATPFPVQYREFELEQLCDFVGAKAFITAAKIGERANAALVKGLDLDSVQTVLAFGDSLPEGVVALSAALAGDGDTAALDGYLADLTVDANDTFTICWTSGTESRPKGVPRSHNDWIAIAKIVEHGAKVGPDDSMLTPFPLVNMGGIGGTLVPWLLSGCTFVIHHPFDMPTFFKQIVINKINYTLLPPAALNMLLMREEVLAQVDISSVRTIGSGSAPLSPWMVAGWQEKGIYVTNFFGSNEGTALVSTPDDMPDPAKRAEFFPRFGVEGYEWSNPHLGGLQTRLVDLATGDEITEAGRPGELRIKGPTIFAGYFKSDDNPFDGQGYFRTGDVFEIAGEGDDARYYRFVDRAKDIIIRGGMNIAPAELEGLIQGHPKVAEAAVIGYPDEVLGEKSCVVVAPKPDQEVTLEEIVAFLREKKIASYKLPERLEIVSALPRNPVGKILKRDLREQL